MAFAKRTNILPKTQGGVLFLLCQLRRAWYCLQWCGIILSMPLHNLRWFFMKTFMIIVHHICSNTKFSFKRLQMILQNCSLGGLLVSAAAWRVGEGVPEHISFKRFCCCQGIELGQWGNTVSWLIYKQLQKNLSFCAGSPTFNQPFCGQGSCWLNIGLHVQNDWVFGYHLWMQRMATRSVNARVGDSVCSVK